MTVSGQSDSRESLRAYLSLARFDHATKHVFIVPGIILAFLLVGQVTDALLTNIIVGFASAVCIASANYVINEWLDREFDAHHPLKSARGAVRFSLSPTIVYLEYALLAAGGLALAAAVNVTFFALSVIFLIAGVIYNVKPFRTKDRVLLDVLSESLNNPIRLMLGWAMVDPTSMPPSSLIFSYWMGGAFLMNAKRLSEYRDLVRMVGKDALVRYRKSFGGYTENRLLVACMLYSMLSGFFVAVFLVKFRIEYVLLFPFLSLLFAVYFGLSLRPQSLAQAPERLFQSRLLIATVGLTGLAFLILSFVHLPILEPLTAERPITFSSLLSGRLGQ